MGNLVKELKENINGLRLSVALCSATAIAVAYGCSRRKEIKKVSILDTIGNTPLVYLPKLSKAAGCHIYVHLASRS